MNSWIEAAEDDGWHGGCADTIANTLDTLNMGFLARLMRESERGWTLGGMYRRGDLPLCDFASLG